MNNFRTKNLSQSNDIFSRHYLLRHLSKIVNKSYCRVSIERIFDLVDVHRSFVEEMMKDVVRFDGRLSLLSISKHEIDPLVQMSRNVVALESLRARGHIFPS